MPITNKDVASVCHEANRRLCQILHDPVQPEWSDAPEWQKQSSLAGVLAIIDNPAITSEGLHKEWMNHKLSEGWVYGDEKDEGLKTHPCLVEYNELPVNQRYKDKVFGAIVRALLEVD